MTETTATWRYALKERVHWTGDAQKCLITARRWVERQILGPYAEYQVQRPTGTLLWVPEADLDAWATQEDAQGDGRGQPAGA